MLTRKFHGRLKRFSSSKRALAIPITYLLLFVSLLAIISVTYSFAIVEISARGALLRASIAKQNMQFLDDNVRSVAWSFGSSEIVYMDDCGSVFHTEASAKNLVLNFTDEQSLNDVVFNSSIGKAFYELEPSESVYEAPFIRGDNRAIINQSAFTMTQLYVATGDYAKEMVLCYRPSATVAVIGASNGKPLNLIRVHIINLNSSQNLILRERFFLKVASVDVTASSSQYEFYQPISSLALKANLDGTLSTVWLPISSIAEGAVVNLEILISNISLERVSV